jgi:hypothetical protein
MIHLCESYSGTFSVRIIDLEPVLFLPELNNLIAKVSQF